MHSTLTSLTTRIAAGGLALFAALALAACGGSSGSSGSSTVKSAAGTQVAPSNLRIELDSKVLTLDPDLASDFNSLAVLHLIGGTLYNVGPDGSPVSILVQSASQTPNHLGWIFKLKPNLKFSNGTPLTAADVVATLDRSRHDPANTSAIYYTEMTNVQALSPTEVRIDTNRPYPTLPLVMTEPEFAVLPKGDLNNGHPPASYFNHLISAGPYTLKLLTTNQVILTRNPYYAGPEPATQTLTFTPIADPTTRLNEVLAGQQDFDADLGANLASQASATLHVSRVHAYGFVNVINNNTRPPFNQLGVRKAVSLALNRQQMVNVLFDGQNVPLSSFWPSTFPGYSAAAQQPGADIAAAKAALKGTTCASGCSFTLVWSPYPAYNASFVQIYAQQLAAIGIHVNLDEVDFATSQAMVSQPSKFQAMTINLYDYIRAPAGLATWALLPPPLGYNAAFSYWKAPQVVHQAVANAIADPTQSNLGAINTLFNRYQPYTTVFDQEILNASRYSSSVIHMASSQFLEIGSK
jgi:peptide/nickel transport system substrate-binding protein